MKQNDKEFKNLIYKTLKPLNKLLRYSDKISSGEKLNEKDSAYINDQIRILVQNLQSPVIRKKANIKELGKFRKIRNNISHNTEEFSQPELEDFWKDIFPALPKIKSELENLLPKENSNSNRRRFRKFGTNVCGDETERQQLLDAIEDFCSSSSLPESEKIDFPENKFSQATKQILEEIFTTKENSAYSQKHKGLEKNIQDDLLEWIKNVDSRLSKENPFEKEAAFVSSLKNKKSEEIADSIFQIQKDYEKISDEKFNFDFYNKKFLEIKEKEEFVNKKFKISKKSKKYKEELKIKIQAVSDNLIEELELNLIERKNAWQLKLIEEMRRKFIEEFFEKLEKFKKLENLLCRIFDETGFLWDLSKGLFDESGFEILKQYADLLEKDKSLNELAATLGKHNRAQRLYEKELREKVIVKNEWKPKPAYKGQISGIRMSSDISSVLPSELALFSNPATKKLFELKFAQNQLMSFKYETFVPEEKNEIQIEEISKEKEEQKGPVIICVDTSGSMSGTPENIAKTITFALSKIALQEKRSCYLISFSTDIETLDLSFKDKTNNEVLSTLVQFLRKSFNGGTDASLALSHAVELLQTENWKNADVLMISDFVMDSLNEDLENKIEIEKKKNTDFFSLVIGSGGNQETMNWFNHNWFYNMNDSMAERHLVEQLNIIKNRQELI